MSDPISGVEVSPADKMMDIANQIASGKTKAPLSMAEKAYLDCINLGHPKAKSTLGFHYIFGTFGEGKSPQGKRLLEEAIKEGDYSAYSHLGLAHAKGRFGQVDYANAFECYESAVDHGDGAAAFNIGVMLLKGQGREVDILRAKLWFEKAEALGVGNATNMISHCDNVVQHIRENARHAQVAGIEYTPSLQNKEQAVYDLKCIVPLMANDGIRRSLFIARRDNKVSVTDIDAVKEISIHVNNLSFHTGIPRKIIADAIIAEDVTEIESGVARMS